MEMNEKFCGNCGFRIENVMSTTKEQKEKSPSIKEIVPTERESSENLYYDTTTNKEEQEFNYCQDCGHPETKGVIYCQVCKSENLHSSKPKNFYPPKGLKIMGALEIGGAALNFLEGLGITQEGGTFALVFGILYFSMALIVLIVVALLLAKITLSQRKLIFIFILECILNLGIGTIIGIPMLIYLRKPRVRAFLSSPNYGKGESAAV